MALLPYQDQESAVSLIYLSGKNMYQDLHAVCPLRGGGWQYV